MARQRDKRDCSECGDQHIVADMYPQEGSLICEPCLHEGDH